MQAFQSVSQEGQTSMYDLSNRGILRNDKKYVAQKHVWIYSTCPPYFFPKMPYHF